MIGRDEARNTTIRLILMGSVYLLISRHRQRLPVFIIKYWLPNNLLSVSCQSLKAPSLRQMSLSSISNLSCLFRQEVRSGVLLLDKEPGAGSIMGDIDEEDEEENLLI